MLYELVKNEKISIGKAAEAMGMRIIDFITDLGKMDIPYFDFSLEELMEDVKSARPSVDENRMIVISDTTPILSLIKIDRLKILEELYKKIIIPKAVYDELIINIDYQDEIDIIKRCTFIQIENVEENLSVVLLQRELNLTEVRVKR